MSNDRTLPIDEAVDLVSFEVVSDGQEIPLDVGILSISVTKAVNKIASARLIILDGDASEEDFPISNEDYFVPGKELEIKAGYQQNTETIFKGIVVKHGVKVKQGKSAKLVIDCKDEAFKMTEGRKSSYFYDSTDSDIIEEIIGNHSLEKEVDSMSVTHQTMVQYQSTDWDFIVSRAEANGNIVLTEDGKVIIQKPDAGQSPEFNVIYGATILEFEGEIDARNEIEAVTAAGWSAANQEMEKVDGAEFSGPNTGNLSATDLSEASGFSEDDLITTAGLASDELQQWADAQVMKSRLSKVKGRVRFQGLGSIKPGKLIELQGLGDRFNGNAFLGVVRHEISQGNWNTDVEVGLDNKWFSEENKLETPLATGLLPGVEGLVIGIATQLAEDPDGEDRIRVVFPSIDGDEEGVWARISTLDAGENRGSFFRPEIGDEVVVGFLNNDPRQAIVLGMMNSSAKPAPIAAEDDNHEKGFVTRGEMRIWFNDDENSITVDTPNGNQVVLSEDSGSILVECENGNKVEMTSDGITMDSPGDINVTASGDVNIEGTNVNITAQAQLKAEGSAGAELSSGASTTVKGSIVQIN